MKNQRLQKMVAITLFSAIAVILSMFLYGPLGGVATAILRGVIPYDYHRRFGITELSQ